MCISDEKIEILNLLKNQPNISYRNLSKCMSVNESAILKHLNSLKKKGIIERIGGTRGYWKIVRF